MKLLESLERRLGKFAIPHLTVYLVALQALTGILALSGPAQRQLLIRLLLQADLVRAGEYWRLVSFLFIPPSLNPLWGFFALYFFWLMGSALEGYWGAFRYNLFLLVGYLSTIAAAFLQPHLPASNGYVIGSVFLAFAALYPDFLISLFFLLPVRIKWLALATWLLYAWRFLFTDSSLERLLIVASVLNILLFFSRTIYLRMRGSLRHMSAQAKTLAERNQPFHVCAACGITDKTHPKMEFRYCPECAGSPGYCENHIRNHEHRKAARGSSR